MSRKLDWSNPPSMKFEYVFVIGVIVVAIVFLYLQTH